MNNPDLINPNVDPSGNRVSPIAAHTAPLPIVEQDEYRYFYCSVQSASMFRTDGKKLPFVKGILKTNLVHDIDYVEKEIKAGNVYVRAATVDEINDYKMIENPRQTMKDQLRPEIEKELEASLRQKIMDELAGKTIDAGRIAGTEGASTATAEVVNGGNFRASIVGSGKIAEAAAGGTVKATSASILAGLTAAIKK